MTPDDHRERFYRAKRRLREDLLRFGDDQQDAQDVGPQLKLHTGDDAGETNLAPLFGRAARRCYGALLSFFGVR